MAVSKLVDSCCINGSLSMPVEVNDDPKCVETNGEPVPVDGNGDPAEINVDSICTNREREPGTVCTGVSRDG